MLLVLAMLILLTGVAILLSATVTSPDPRSGPAPGTIVDGALHETMRLRLRIGTVLCVVGLLVLGTAVYVEVHESHVAGEMLSRGVDASR